MTGAILAILSGSQVNLFSYKIAILKSEKFFILHSYSTYSTGILTIVFVMLIQKRSQRLYHVGAHKNIEN